MTASGFSKNKRWAAVSASRTAEDDFKLAVKDVSRAHAYICICKPPFFRGNDDGDDDEDDEEEASKANCNGDKAKCDGGEKCLCQKPANEHPDHAWILTYGGFRKWISQLSMAAVRCPDFFDMYTFNDHEAYGLLEVNENLMLEWEEAKTWPEQWTVCEGLALFLLGEGQIFSM